MAVYRWIYSNARLEGDEQDFLVRLCDPPLKEYKETLLLLSQRLLSMEKRYGQAEKQICWFSGYIEKEQKMYVVAVGGKQDFLLGMSLTGGFRTQFCVLGYGLTGEDIRIYRKEEALFEPLKEILRKIQTTGKDLASESKESEITQFSMDRGVFQEKETIIQTQYNIQKSNPEFDNAIWKQSRQRQVMTGVLSVEDAKRLLDLFPRGIVTVIGDIPLQQYSAKKRNVTKLNKETEKVRQDNTTIPFVSKEDTIEDTKFSTILKNKIKNVLNKKEEQLLSKEDINNCAIDCRDKLPQKQVENIRKAIDKLALDKTRTTRLRYYCYMVFWEMQVKNSIFKEETIYQWIIDHEFHKLSKEDLFRYNSELAKGILALKKRDRY